MSEKASGMTYDITGNTYGSWIVLSFEKRVGLHTYWNCKCACGNIKSIRGDALKNGNTSKCHDCHRAATVQRNKDTATHKMSKTRLYREWRGMFSRCIDKNKNYLKNGITVCKEWAAFESFRDWALANGYKDNLTIERKNVYGNYEPDNCCWETMKKQQANRCNTIRLEDGSMAWEVAEMRGITRASFDKRRKLGWSVDKIINTPMRKSVNGKYVVESSF